MYHGELKHCMAMLYPGAEEYDAVLESIAAFIAREIRPGAARIDREEIFPRENLRRLADLGVPALPFPQRMGGRGLPYPVYVAALEMLAAGCANTALQLSIQGMVCEGILLYGSEAQQELFLRKNGLLEGKSLAAFALTEPCCGSDAKAIRSEARLSGDNYILNGTKTLITSPGEADFILLFAVAEQGISAFIVSTASPGFQVIKVLPKLGCKGHKLSTIRLENCRVPAANLLGAPGKGLDYGKHFLNCGRITIAALGVGIAQAALEKALAYSTRRKAFGSSISEFQLVQEKLADMVTEIQATRLMTFHAARLKERGTEYTSAAAQAKLFSSEMSQRVCDKAIQIHGGYGYTDGCDVHRHWRDARMLSIGEGTSDMLRLLIAHRALKQGVSP
jgi:alkylation response protein AidB-like acyl-CoA dehydrogenase